MYFHLADVKININVIQLEGEIVISGFSEFWNGLDWSVLTDILISIIPALLCITFHELSHGFAAWKLGDDTARRQGRLTLNPIKHIDIMGLIMMVVFKFGWAKPVPVNMFNFKRPKEHMAITALAGPVSNIILAAFLMLLFGFIYVPLAGLGQAGTLILDTILTTAYMSCALAVFNIVPIPPLDGSKILFAFLSSDKYYKLMRYEKYGMLLLLVLIYFDLLTPYVSRLSRQLYGLLSAISQWSFSLTV